MSHRRRAVPDLSPGGAFLLMAAMLWPLCLPAADILRAGRAATPVKDSADGAPATVTPTAAPALVTAQDRLARTTQALSAVRQMQQAARNLAKAGADALKPNLPAVPANSFGVANGLVVAKGVPKDLANPVAGENAALWSGASLPHGGNDHDRREHHQRGHDQADPTTGRAQLGDLQHRQGHHADL
ncbi:MAG: hypothetical protein WDM96_09675 [Lacunisphaera sp.]